MGRNNGRKQRNGMKNKIFIAGTLILGVIIGLVVPHFITGYPDTGWRQLIPGKHHFGVGFSTEAIFSDLPMPDIKLVAGKGKFLEGDGAGAGAEFGYIITIDMADLDFSKVPQQYKEALKTVINGHEVETAPLTNAYYKIEWEFRFKDKDGFLIHKVKSEEPEYLISGKTTVFQGKITEKIPYSTALKVNQIELYPSITKCESCKK
jgi:hypothetical protein